MLEEDNNSTQNNERPINAENVDNDNKRQTPKTIETSPNVNQFNENDDQAARPQQFTQK
jgi:hypothetical protein